MLGIQGAVSEHIHAMEKTLDDAHTAGTVLLIKQPQDIEPLDALIIPGGESTTISKALSTVGLYECLRSRIQQRSLAVMGTCAGCVLLAKEHTTKNDVTTLQAMDMQVERNAFGRQKESFEQMIFFDDFSEPYSAVFIRAPVITRVWDGCTVLAKVDKKIVAARQQNLLAVSFHPELTADLRVHRYFLEMILS